MCPNWRRCCRFRNSSSPCCKGYATLKVDMKGKHESTGQSHRKTRCLTSPQHRHERTQRQVTTGRGLCERKRSPNDSHHHPVQESSLVLCSLHNLFAEWASLASTPSRVLPSKLKFVLFGSLAKKKKRKYHNHKSLSSICVRDLITVKGSVFIITKMT